ncbi:MAG TPA: aldo/keto reductase [Candidatus Sphingobacterium stercoripullorum]|nr:aldo/keto reductase [Candidatus Sphingobacterium stercoripullorum]
MEITRNTLGKSTLEVSSLGLGTMSLFSKNAVESTKIVHKALEAGVNFLDTADLYEKGENEKLIGKAIQNKRDQIVLATKVGNQWRADGSGWDWKASGPYIIKHVEESLKRLGTDYIDLYQLHGGMIEDPIDEIIEAFEGLKKQGKIRFYGISSIRINVIKAYLKRSHISSIMMQYSLLDRRPEEILDTIAVNQVGVISRGVLAQGLLLKKPLKSYLGYNAFQIEQLRNKVREVAQEYQVTPLHVVWDYVRSNEAITSLLAAPSSMKQLDELLEAHNTKLPINREEYDQLFGNLLPPIFYTEHRE